MASPVLQRALFVCMLSVNCLPALAVDFYDADILVFRQPSTQGEDEELNVPNIRNLDLNIELQDLLDRTPTIHLDPAIESYLTNATQRIADNADYEILFHGRWSQTTSDRKVAPYIQIDLPSIHGSRALTGVLRLFSTDLLYVDVFLRYQPERQMLIGQNSRVTEQNAGPYYFLKERRRVKFREIHFLDHPKFGVLLTIWPVKLPDLPLPINASEPLLEIDPLNIP